MGGKNHQPCRRFLKHSTKMSRAFSVAFCELELANVALEDLLLSELDGVPSPGFVDEMLSHLFLSQAGLKNAQVAMTDIRGQMQQEQFQDLPTLQSVNLDQVGEGFASAEMVNNISWKHVVRVMRTQGFSGVLTEFESESDKLYSLTNVLMLALHKNRNSADVGELTLILEENRYGNFKLEFARLYNAWSEFQQFFLASSMCSTELWYRFNRFGSLVLHNTEITSVA